MQTFRVSLGVVLAWLLLSINARALPEQLPHTRQVAIEWHHPQPRGTIEVANGRLVDIEIVKGKGTTQRNAFSLESADDARIVISLDDTDDHRGSGTTLVTVRTDKDPFSFFLRDVNSDYPIYIPGYQVAVTRSDDPRSYSQIESAIKKRKLKTKHGQIEAEPEETFEAAASRTRNQPCPTWLGVSRDMRIFELSDNRTNPGSEMDMIRPRNASSQVKLPELDNKPAEYGYVAGRGQSVAVRSTRRLEDGALPILHSTFVDGEITYHSIAFATLEQSALSSNSPSGTEWLVADAYSGGHMFTKEQEELARPRIALEQEKGEETVLYYRLEATNSGAVPRYAWFKTVRPGASWWMKTGVVFDPQTGYSKFSASGKVFAISRLDGQPLRDEETAVLLRPGERAVFEFLLPHSPLSEVRAADLARQSFDARYNECRAFWKGKLESAARMTVPEQRINEMIRAGLLQLDLTTYGNEPDSALAPTIGVYAPIGTESAPIIQFYNSMGWGDVARRSLMYFLLKQHDDGMIQNFGGYQGETGAALWTLGEYFRYTRDKEWVKQVEPHVLKACDFLLRWRETYKVPELRGKGYGMIAGKVADPEDLFHQFMLNAYAYLGISRAAEMLKDIDREQSQRLDAEAKAWQADIRSSLMASLANAPVVPLGDGRWSPTVPPWTEAQGPRALHVNRETYYSHGTVTAPDVLLGPLYLVFCEVLSPEDPVSRIMLEYTSELFLEDNAAFSQPYYSRHDWVQLKLGMVKPFLKTYYNTLSALADRETYTFWEHLFQVSPHKTHEQAWFLMQTRWMLYLEEGRTLKLLPGIPRKWLEDGKQTVLNNVRSYFGPLSLRVESKKNASIIDALISCSFPTKPDDVIIRLPHPRGQKAVRVSGGTYDARSESVTIRGFSGSAHVRVEF